MTIIETDRARSLAHRDAYEKFGLLHRDISTGNILILPRIVENNGKKIVLWHGLLTDWELAKYVPKDNSLEHARQPERTVCSAIYSMSMCYG